METKIKLDVFKRHISALDLATKRAKEILITQRRSQAITNTAVYITPDEIPGHQRVRSLNIPLGTDTIEDWYLTYCLPYFILNPKGPDPKLPQTTDPRDDWKRKTQPEMKRWDGDTIESRKRWVEDQIRPENYLDTDWIIKKALRIPEPEETPRLSPMIEVNEHFRDKWIADLTEVSFDALYPHEINRLLKTCKSSLPSLDSVFQLAIDMRTESKLLMDTPYSDVPLRIKQFLNATYGMVGSPNSPLEFTIDLPATLVRNTRRMMSTISTEFSSHVVNIDTDTVHFIYFSEIEYRFRKRHSQHKFTAVRNLQGIFMGKKKCIIRNEDGTIRVRGIRTA